MKTSPIKLSLKTERFRVNPKTECWEWGMTGREGYGQLIQNDQVFDMHRLSYSIFVKELHFGQCVLHKCDNRSCFNPAHLFVGTRQDNAKDRDLKGRVTRGEQHYKTKLSEEEVKAIRRDVAGGKPRKSVAKEYGISVSSVTMIILKKNWKHI